MFVRIEFNGDKNAMYIITCAHVIEAKNAQIIVQSADGTQYDAVIVGTDIKVRQRCFAEGLVKAFCRCRGK